MACRQRQELIAPVEEEGTGGDDERAGLPLDEGGESGVDLAFGAGLQDMELHPLRPRAVSPHGLHHALRSRNVRVYEQGDHLGLGNQLGKQLKPLGVQLGTEEADAREVAARPGDTSDEAIPRPGRRWCRRRSGSSTLPLWLRVPLGGRLP